MFWCDWIGTGRLITVQLLRANGCNVVGFDVREDRLKPAEKFGAKAINIDEIKDPEPQIMEITKSWFRCCIFAQQRQKIHQFRMQQNLHENVAG